MIGSQYETFVSIIGNEIFNFLEENNKSEDETTNYALQLIIILLMRISDYNPSSYSLSYEERLFLDKLEELFRKFDCDLNIDYDFIENLDIPSLIEKLMDSNCGFSEQQLETLIKMTSEIIKLMQNFKIKGNIEDIDSLIEQNEDDEIEEYDEEKNDELRKITLKRIIVSFSFGLLYNCLVQILQSSSEAERLTAEIFKAFIEFHHPGEDQHMG
jgi:hypothetical protein